MSKTSIDSLRINTKTFKWRPENNNVNSTVADLELSIILGEKGQMYMYMLVTRVLKVI